MIDIMAEIAKQLKDNVEEIFGAGAAAFFSVFTNLSTYIGGTVMLATMESDILHECIKSIFVIFNAAAAAIIVHMVKKWLEKRNRDKSSVSE